MFCVYLRDDQLITLVTDLENPYPATTDIWNNETEAFERFSTPPGPQKIIFNCFQIKKEDMDNFLRIHIPKAIEKEFDTTVKKDSTYTFDQRNILLLTKDFGSFYEAGLGIFKGWYHNTHELGQKICDSYLKLKAFW
jgi:hypothetical protein